MARFAYLSKCHYIRNGLGWAGLEFHLEMSYCITAVEVWSDAMRNV